MNYRILICISLVAALLFSTSRVHASEKNCVEGTVIDIGTGTPVEGAVVFISGTSLNATTNNQGHYFIENLPDGVYDIQVSHIAYMTKTRRNISLEDGKTEVIDVQITSAIIEMPEIVISAERTEQTSKSTSATVNVLSAEEITRRNASTLDQALESIPGVTVGRSAGTATNSLSIRGSSDMRGGGIGNRVLLLVDGRPAITADTGGANWGMLPMNIVKRVEVVKGALSPLYGSNAMGGVVNFITMSPTPSRSTRLEMGWGYFGKQPESLKYTDQLTDFADLGMVHSNTYRNLGYILSLNGKTSDGHRQNTDFSLYNFYSKIQYSQGQDSMLNLSFGRMSVERGYPHIWSINSVPPYVHPLKIAYEKTNDRQEKDSWNFDLSLRSMIHPGLKLAAGLYHSRDYSRSLFNPDDLEGDNRSHGFITDSDARKTGGLLQMDISRFYRNYLILGLDLQIDSVDSHPADVMFGEHQAETLAGFAQDRITISEAFAVMLGARYDYRHLAEGSDEGQISPKLGLTYQVDADTILRLSLGQAFRAPSLAEIYIKQSLHSGLKFKENPQLKSEKLRAYAEFGVKRGLFGLLETDTSVFIYDFSDMIFWDSLSEDEYQVVNLNSSIIKGAETSVRFFWRGLTSAVGYTYLDAQDRTENRVDDTLPYKPKHSAHIALDYEYARLAAGTSFRYVSDIEEAIFYPNDAPDAFYVLNVRLAYSLSHRILISVAVNNLLNRQYEEMARYRMPGRSIAFRAVTQIH